MIVIDQPITSCRRGDRIALLFAALHESAFGTCETSTDVCSTVAFGGKADLEQAAQQTSQRFAAVFDAVVEACGLNMDEIVFPPAPIASLSHRIA
jgi:hypothetical protein